MEKALRQQLPGGTFAEVTPQRSKAMAAVKGKGNKTTERRLRAALARAGISGWKIGQRDIIGKPDFFFPKVRVAIFVDGCFWHGCPKCGHYPKTNSGFWRAKIERNRARDMAQLEALKASGVSAIRFWEHELRLELSKCVQTIRRKALDRQEV